MDLAFLRSFPADLLRSNSFDLAIVALGASACVYRARTSSGYPRQAWILLAIALGLDSIAQAITTYYQSFVPEAAHSPWPSDVLFFVWPAPLFLLFLPSDDLRADLDWLRLFDFFQVAIVALTSYLYFFYSPSRWLEQFSVLRQILILYTARDFLLAVGFAFRARSSLPSWLRSFCLALSCAFGLSILANLAYLSTLSASSNQSSWADVIWMFPYACLLGFAAYWRQPPVDQAPAAQPSAAAPTVASQLLPVTLPLLVIFMCYAIAREHVVLAWLAVAASVLSSSIRLILTNQQQRRTAEHLLEMEKALRRTEKTLSSAFRSSPDAFSINPFPNGRYFEVNDGFTSLTGYSREDALGKTPRELNLWVDPSERSRVLSRLTESGFVRDVEFRFRKKSGEIRFGDLSASLIDFDGTPCSLVMVRDITDHKEAEEILRSSEERFRSLVQNLHVGILSYDSNARITYANSAALEALGVPLHQIIGKTVADLRLFAIDEHRNPIPDHLLAVPTAIATRLPQRNRLMGWRIPGQSEVVWTLLDAVPEFSSTGDLSRIVVSFTDLTAQRRAADALRDSEERFRTLVRDLHVAVVLYRPDGAIEYANPAAYRMFGLPDGTAVGRFPSDYGVVPVTEDAMDIPPDQHPVISVFRSRTPIENGVLGLRYPGSPDRIVWVFGNVVPQLDPQGNVTRIISAFSDITEMKNAERAIHNLTSHLLNVQDEERRRLGRELHDGLAQTVLAINLSLAQARQSIHGSASPAALAIEKARQLTHQISREIRTLSYLLHPPLLDDLGLVSALKEYVQGFSDRSGIDTQLFVLSPFDRLPQPVETALFRVVQESLTNIQRHSGSSAAKIRLRQEHSLVTLEITDYGQGLRFPIRDSQPDEARLGVGIRGMRERMALLGGKLHIFSDDSGTTIRATIPVTAPSLAAHPVQPVDVPEE